MVLNDLQHLSYYEALWSEAPRFYERSRDAAVVTGDSFMTALQAVNMAEIYRERGACMRRRTSCGDLPVLVPAVGSRWVMR